jgi:hypothetical protein
VQQPGETCLPGHATIAELAGSVRELLVPEHNGHLDLVC